MRIVPALIIATAALSVPALAQEKPSKAAPSVDKSQRPLAEILTGPALDAYLKGRDLFDAGDTLTGHAKLLEAYELSKNPRLLWNMAACSKSSRHYSRAIDELTRFLQDGREQITADQAKRAEDVRATLYSLVAAVTLKVAPEGASVSLDDEPLVHGEGPYYLELGKHEFRVEHAGFQRESRVVDVKSTKPLTLEFSLRADAVAPAVAAPVAQLPVATPAPAAAVTDVPSSEPDRTWAYVALGVGAAGVVAGSTFGVLAWREASRLDSDCTAGVCPSSSQNSIDGARRWATLSTASWIVGGIGLAGGALLYFMPPTAPAPTALRITPASVSLEGSF
jgi:hypothetical protein